MHITTHSRLKQFWQKHPTSEPGLRYWYKLTIESRWKNFNEIRQTFPSADSVSNFTVFNIGGNEYRLIVYIDYEYGKVFIRNILTHADYNKEDWKKDNWYN